MPGGSGRQGHRPPRIKKTALAEGMDAEAEQEIEALLGAAAVEALDWEAVETAWRRRVRRVAARVLETRLKADPSDYQGAEIDCACGQSARYVDRRRKTFVSVLGELNLERAYDHGERGQSGFCPRDRALGLVLSSLTLGVQRMTASAAAVGSFEESRELRRELAGVEVSTKQVERVAEGLGREVAADERQTVEKTAPPAPTLYLGMDGTGVPMRTLEVAA